MNQIPAIVQARMGSTRLPGKMLRRVAGKPMLQYVIERLHHCEAVGDIVVATTVDEADTAIVDFCREARIACVRGPVEDVASRFRRVLDTLQCDSFARICGDRPLLDMGLLSRGATLYGQGVDLVTNVHPRTFPAGQTVEIARTGAFVDACARMTEQADREHVTRYFYQHPSEYRIVNFDAERRFDGVHLAIDTERDFQRFESIVHRMQRPHWSYDLNEVVALYREAA